MGMYIKLTAGVALGAWGLLGAALYFQYAMGLEPCIQCVYQRLAVLGIAVFTSLAFFRRGGVLGAFSLMCAFASALYGVVVAKAHVDIQSSTNPFFSGCSIAPEFPFNLPLDTYLPWIFKASGPCGEVDWAFAGLSMPEWVLGWMIAFSAALLLLLLLQLVKSR